MSATIGALSTSLLLGSDPVCGSALGTFEAGRRELDPYQGKRWNNYAVGFYNAPGGVTIGRVWADHGQPDPAVGLMPERTVAAKLLFATAPFEGVPYLAGAPTWNAYVYADPNDPKPTATSPRAVLPVRLLQIDIGVKDARLAPTTGWALGTFVYGGGPGGKAGEAWRNVEPVGLMWGNDPDYTGTGELKETVFNPEVHIPHNGYQGRLNGPVDNPKSSCTSCHSTAEAPSGSMFPGKDDDRARWFRNVRLGEPFDPGRTSLDYSLQVSVGIATFREAQSRDLEVTPSALRTSLIGSMKFDETPPRDGGPLD